MEIQFINTHTLRVDFFSIVERLIAAAIVFAIFALVYSEEGAEAFLHPVFWLILMAVVVIMTYQKTVTINGATRTLSVRTVFIPYIIESKKYFMLNNLGEKKFYIESRKVYSRGYSQGRMMLFFLLDSTPGPIKLKKRPTSELHKLTSLASRLNDFIVQQVNQKQGYLDQQDNVKDY